jgi:hypothetical protein
VGGCVFREVVLEDTGAVMSEEAELICVMPSEL